MQSTRNMHQVGSDNTQAIKANQVKLKQNRHKIPIISKILGENVLLSALLFTPCSPFGSPWPNHAPWDSPLMKFMLRGQNSWGRAQRVVSTLFLFESLNSRVQRHLGLLAAVLAVHDREVRLEPDDGVQV